MNQITLVKANGYRDDKPVTDKEYKLLNGTYFDGNTPDTVCFILSSAMQTRQRLKIYNGDSTTGKDWMEEHGKYITVGRSTGTIKIPLAILTVKSYGGGSLLEDCIVKIVDKKTGVLLYQHANYTPGTTEIKENMDPALSEYSHVLYVNGELYSRHKTLKSAKQLKAKLS